MGVAVPILLTEIIDCADCEKYEIKRFEIEILVSESLMAAISLGCVSHSIRKYGVRKFLFVDRYHGLMLLFRDEYIQRINVSFTAPTNPLFVFNLFYFMLVNIL